LSQVKKQCREEATILIFGNKKDLDDQPGKRQVAMTEAAKYAQENECLFVEGSAFSGENVEEAFSKLTNTIIYKVDTGEIPSSVVATVNTKGAGSGEYVVGSASSSGVNLKDVAATESAGCYCWTYNFDRMFRDSVATQVKGYDWYT